MGFLKIHTNVPGYGSRLLEAIDKLQPRVVCFDYFDTLVHRHVAPEDVKRIACERIARLVHPATPEPVSGESLYLLRQAIELRECNLSEESGHDLEFVLPEAWGRIWDAEPRLHRLDRGTFIETALQIEIAVECQTQHVCEEMREVVEKLAAKGVPMALVSDFYLPSTRYRAMLDAHGLGKHFNTLFISSDTRLTKRSGRLFPVVSEKLDVPFEHMLMIGDNVHSDAEMPSSKGIPAIHLDRAEHHERYQKLSVASANHAAIESRLAALLHAPDAPFSELALTLYFFIDTLHHSLMQSGVRDVFFMAREGQFLKVLFDDYQSRRSGAVEDGTKLRSHYFKVSRRATFLPSLSDLAREDFHTLFRQYRRISLHEFLSSIGLENASSMLASRIPHDFSCRVDDLPTSEAFASLLADEAFQDAYETARHSHQQAFLAYIEAFGADTTHREIHLVDVGWKGTIQDNLRKIFDQLPGTWRQCDITGHYIGLVAPGAMDARNIKLGLVFNALAPPTPYLHVFNENRALFEVALGADHGSASAYEIDEMHMPRVVEDAFQESTLFEEKIRPLQSQLLRTFRDIDQALSFSYLPRANLEKVVARAHARMVFKPSPEEIRWFEDVFHIENFGVFEASRFGSSNRRPNLIDALRFYWKLRRSPQGVDMGFWPWLRCYQQGGQLVAWRYARSRLRSLGE